MGANFTVRFEVSYDFTGQNQKKIVEDFYHRFYKNDYAISIENEQSRISIDSGFRMYTPHYPRGRYQWPTYYAMFKWIWHNFPKVEEVWYWNDDVGGWMGKKHIEFINKYWLSTQDSYYTEGKEDRELLKEWDKLNQ